MENCAQIQSRPGADEDGSRSGGEPRVGDRPHPRGGATRGQYRVPAGAVSCPVFLPARRLGCSIWPNRFPALRPTRLAEVAREARVVYRGIAVRAPRARPLSQHGGHAEARMAPSSASIARCISPTIRFTTRSTTSPPAISDSRPSIPRLAASAPWFAGTSGIPKARV